jgi:hypothetical protein
MIRNDLKYCAYCRYVGKTRAEFMEVAKRYDTFGVLG